ncbi:TauD/TfdA family dioxygenase [Nocardia amamiensis]|uniref:TauD/TfdA family dioxygenase n=1 Tax=Nocardia amamiensis TaxID=404578 RepID=UPI00083532E0|nr:TauD/TfdA family dioxygenase [Nocardia amamiensis]
MDIQEYSVDTGAMSAAEYASTHHDEIIGRLNRHGRVLIRAAAPRHDTATAEFARATETLGFNTLAYRERSTPRSEVSAGIFTSTEYPPREAIPLHCESSYASVWPGRIAFYCVNAPTELGATPTADMEAVLDALSMDIREELAVRGLAYVRNFSSGVGLTWQEAFQTADRGTVEEFLRSSGSDWKWTRDDSLRTTRHGNAVVTHPRIATPTWFNHLNLFHPATLAPGIRHALVSCLGPTGLPNLVTFADGSLIPDHLFQEVRKVHERNTDRFDWHPGDMLLLDNMRFAHGREPYRGNRRILVAMSDPITAANVQPAL